MILSPSALTRPLPNLIFKSLKSKGKKGKVKSKKGMRFSFCILVYPKLTQAGKEDEKKKQKFLIHSARNEACKMEMKTHKNSSESRAGAAETRNKL